MWKLHLHSLKSMTLSQQPQTLHMSGLESMRKWLALGFVDCLRLEEDLGLVLIVADQTKPSATVGYQQRQQLLGGPLHSAGLPDALGSRAVVACIDQLPCTTAALQGGVS